MWRKVRIAILLFILATVGHRAWLQQQLKNWNDTLYVVLYPVNASHTPATAEYLRSLKTAQFQPLEYFFAEEAERYGLDLKQPFHIELGPMVNALPPAPPHERSVIQTILWSLHFRWWSWKHSPAASMPADIQLYLLYHDPAKGSLLGHSTALNKGRIGIVNVFADHGHDPQNTVVIAHELLHTLDATDKYDLGTNQPVYPDGFAEPGRQPLYPQQFAELMAGRVPVSKDRAEIPSALADTVIGHKTASEIGWLRYKL